MKRLILGAAFGCLMSVANARDLGQWQSVNPEVREWYQALKQPDHPAISCCGEADAYWADSFEVDGDNTSPSLPTLGPMNRCAADISTLGQRLSFRTIS